MLHCKESIEYQHVKEHARIAIMAFVGSTMGVGFDVLHLISQNFVFLLDGDIIEMLQNFSGTFLIAAFCYFVLHVLKEENNKHPFYLHGGPMGVIILK